MITLPNITIVFSASKNKKNALKESEYVFNNMKKLECKQKEYFKDKFKPNNTAIKTAIKRVEKPSQFHIVDATEVSFTSAKIMDEDSCTACQICYRVCPTGALTSDIKNSKIDFDPFLCIKCNICHDVCEPDAITLSSSYNIKEFFEPTVQNLISFKVRRCNECNVIFSTNSNDRLCYRCKAEDEAKVILKKLGRV